MYSRLKEPNIKKFIAIYFLLFRLADILKILCFLKFRNKIIYSDRLDFFYACNDKSIIGVRSSDAK